MANTGTGIGTGDEILDATLQYLRKVGNQAKIIAHTGGNFGPHDAKLKFFQDDGTMSFVLVYVPSIHKFFVYEWNFVYKRFATGVLGLLVFPDAGIPSLDDVICKAFDDGARQLEAAHPDSDFITDREFDPRTGRHKFFIKHDRLVPESTICAPLAWQNAARWLPIDIIVQPWLEDVPDCDGADVPYDDLSDIMDEAYSFYVKRGLGLQVQLLEAHCRTGYGLMLKRDNTAIPIAPCLQQASERMPLAVVTEPIRLGKLFAKTAT